MTVETAPAPAASRPSSPLPAHACDSHSHVFGPFDRFPPLARSVYALPQADPAVHAALRQTLGVERGVLTQPAPYGDDPGAMLAAIACAQGALRGVAVASPGVDPATLERWRSGGIVGLRFTEMLTPAGGRYPGSVGFAALESLAPTMRAIGLHAQLWAKAADLAAWIPRLLPLGVRLVIDHMGCPDPARGPADKAFAAILAAMRGEDVWTKLVVCRVSKGQSSAYEDVRPFHDALLDANPDQVVWGSDWPYVRMEPAPDAGRMADLLQAWTPEAALQRRILVDNPARLYGFERTAAP